MTSITTLTINSKDRSSGSSSASNFQISSLEIPGITDYRINYIYLPYSWYNIDSNYNKIYINSTLYTIPAGQYTAPTLAAQIQTTLGGSFTCTYSSTTGMFTIANNANFTLDLNNTLMTLRRQIGFNSTTQLTGATTYTSDSFANLLNGSSIYLCSQVLSKVQNSLITDSKLNYVTSIPINQVPGDIIMYQPTQDILYNLQSPTTFKNLDIQLKDLNNNIINLNGVDWELQLILFKNSNGK